MKTQTIIHYEVTDTYGGESNYSWVRRGKIEGKPGETISDLAAVRRVKKEIGWNGGRCKTDNFGDDIDLRPQGTCLVCFINFENIEVN